MKTAFFVVRNGAPDGGPYPTRLAAERAADAERLLLKKMVDRGWLSAEEFKATEIRVGRVQIGAPVLRETARISYSAGAEPPVIADIIGEYR